MKKQWHYFIINLALLNPLISIAAEIPSSKPDTKQLEQRYGLFKKARQDYDDALVKFQACARVCEAEKSRLLVTRLKKGRRSKEASRSYPAVNKAYRVCLAEKCPKEYEKFIKADAALNKRINGLIIGVYFGLLGGAALAVGAAMGGIAITKNIIINQLIKKYELANDPKAKAILEAFWDNRNIHRLVAQGYLSTGEISDGLRNALAEIYYGARPTQQQIDQFNGYLNKYNIVVLEPSL